MHSKTDKIIRETDFDALSSRLSAYLKGYLPTDTPLLLLIPLLIHYQLLSTPSEFTQFALSRRLKRVFFNLFSTNLKPLSLSEESSPKIQISPFSSFKPPLINRGTYLRTSTITQHLTEILDKYPDEEIQIVSLGAGNDTRPFTLLPLYSNLKYFELDFDSTTKLKKLAILSSPKLSSLVNAKPFTAEKLPLNLDDILMVSSDFHTTNYHLIPIDLRDLKPDLKLSNIPGLGNLDENKRTIVISECCICYLSQNDSNDLLLFWAKNLNNGEFLIYEPIGGVNENNTYGDVMVKNLGGRGIEMPALMVYNTTESQLKRFKKILVDCSKKNIWCNDMKWVYYNMVDGNEINRISKLEMLDEMEELNLINSHYCLIIADWGRL